MMRNSFLRIPEMKPVFKTIYMPVAFAMAGLALPMVSADLAPAYAATDSSASDKFFQSAMKYVEQGRLPEAIIDLRNAVQRDPANMQARLLLGQIQYRMGDMASAEKEALIVHEKRPSDEAEILLGQVYAVSGRYEEALKVVAENALTNENKVKKLLIRGDAYLSLKKSEKARDHFLAAQRLQPDRPEIAYGLTRVKSDLRDYQGAKADLQAILDDHPDFAPAWMLKGEIALAEKNRNEAFDAFDRAVQIQPNNVNAYVARARAHLTSGKTDLARADAKRVVQLSPGNPIGYYLNAAIAYAQGDVKQADQEYRRIAETMRTFPPAILLGALIKFNVGDLNQAERLLTKYIQLDPDNVKARRALATVRIRMDQPQSAVDIAENLLKEDQNDVATLQILASAYVNLDDFDKAGEIYTRISRSGSPSEVRQAGAALKLLGNSIVGEKNIDNQEMTDELGQRVLKVLDFISNDDLEAARNEVKQLKARYPDNPIVLNVEGGVLMARKNFPAARDVFKKALSYNPEFMSAIENLDRLDIIENNPEGIEERIRTLLGENPKSDRLTVRYARFLVEQGRVGEAVGLLSNKSSELPDSSLVAESLVRAYFINNQRAKAAEAAMRLVEISEDDPVRLVFAVEALRDADEAEWAVDVARKLVSAAPESTQSHMMLAQSLITAGRVEDAKKVLRNAFEANPKSRLLARGLADIAIQENDFASAEEITRKLGEYDPIGETSLKADVLIKLERLPEAIKMLEDRLIVSPTEELAIDLFEARRIAGRTNDALEGLRTWTISHPRDKRALATHAQALLELQRYGEAESSYEKLLAAQPNNPIALNNYAWIRNELGRPDALDYAERAYRINSGSPEIADTLGWLMVQHGRLKDGLQVLRNAASQAPDNADILYHLAYAMAKTGAKDDAKELLANLIENGGNFAGRADAKKLLESIQ